MIDEENSVLKAEIQRLNQRLILLEAAEAKRERIAAELRTEVEFSANLINALPLFFVALDSSGKPIMMNQVMLNALGYTPDEVLGVDYLSTFISEKDAAKVLSAFEAIARRQPSPLLSEYRMKTRADQELLVEWRSRPVFRQDHQLDFIFSIGLDVTERRQAEQDNARLFEQVQVARNQLERLAHQLVAVQEEERLYISRELHDEAGQALTALKINLTLMQSDLTPECEPFRQPLGEATAVIDATLNRIRLLAQDLRPPALDAIGLNLTLKDLGHRFAKRTHISVKYEGQELSPLPGTINICLYRFLQEALTNVAKHTSATQIQVNLKYENEMIKLSVADNGQGFDPRLQGQSPRHRRFPGLGLLGMHERLAQLRGQLVINSQPGQGTYLEAQVPWPEEGL
jgi:PAS domain S-box-containing protein